MVGDMVPKSDAVGAIFGGFDYSQLLPAAVPRRSPRFRSKRRRKQGAVFAYGKFFTVVMNFAILAWIIFLMVRTMNEMRRRLERETSSSRQPPPRRRTSRCSLKSATSSRRGSCRTLAVLDRRIPPAATAAEQFFLGLRPR